MPVLTEEQRIVDGILARMNEDARVNAAEVKVDVSVRNRSVTLRGTVHSFQARRAAEDAARGEPGIRHVHNFIVVPLPDPADFMDARAPGDEGVRARVNQYLRGQDVLEAERIDVTVENGAVMLEGSVNAFWKKQRAGEVVLGVEGVLSVENRLAVVPTRKADDEALAARLMDAMADNFFLAGHSLDVKVNNGLVTLRGDVASRDARWEAFQIALYMEGVADVRDEMRR
jgi:osmotically-inducible protein OsmY